MRDESVHGPFFHLLTPPAVCTHGVASFVNLKTTVPLITDVTWLDHTKLDITPVLQKFQHLITEDVITP